MLNTSAISPQCMVPAACKKFFVSPIITIRIGKYKNKELTGIVILKDLVQKDKNYEDGEITDPENGKTYSCYVKLENTNKLKIRGYIGFSLLGRTEYWYRLNKQDKDALNQILNNK